MADQAILVRNVNFLPILLGGDQLTAARARGSKSLRASHDSAKDRLDGLVPVVEDWHARVTENRKGEGLATQDQYLTGDVILHSHFGKTSTRG